MRYRSRENLSRRELWYCSDMGWPKTIPCNWVRSIESRWRRTGLGWKRVVPGVGLWAGVYLVVGSNCSWKAFPALATGFVGWLNCQRDVPLGEGKADSQEAAKRDAMAFARSGPASMDLVAAEMAHMV